MDDRTVRLEIEALEDGESSAPDCVVWNAWIDKCHGIADMEDEDYKSTSAWSLDSCAAIAL